MSSEKKQQLHFICVEYSERIDLFKGIRGVDGGEFCEWEIMSL